MLTSCDDLVNESEGGVANFKLFVVYSDNLFSLYDKIWTKNEFYNNKKKNKSKATTKLRFPTFKQNVQYWAFYW